MSKTLFKATPPQTVTHVADVLQRKEWKLGRRLDGYRPNTTPEECRRIAVACISKTRTAYSVSGVTIDGEDRDKRELVPQEGFERDARPAPSSASRATRIDNVKNADGKGGDGMAGGIQAVGCLKSGFMCF